MTIKEAIKKYVNSRPKNRKRPLTLNELDGHVCILALRCDGIPSEHSVRARISELTASGFLTRVGAGEYIRTPEEEVNAAEEVNAVT